MTTRKSFGVHSAAPSFFAPESAWRQLFVVTPLPCVVPTYFPLMGSLAFCGRNCTCRIIGGRKKPENTALAPMWRFEWSRAECLSTRGTSGWKLTETLWRR